MKTNLVSQYMTESVTWGGLPTTRIEMIRTMQSWGYTEREIDWAMFVFNNHEGAATQSA